MSPISPQRVFQGLAHCPPRGTFRMSSPRMRKRAQSLLQSGWEEVRMKDETIRELMGERGEISEIMSGLKPSQNIGMGSNNNRKWLWCEQSYLCAWESLEKTELVSSAGERFSRFDCVTQHPDAHTPSSFTEQIVSWRERKILKAVQERVRVRPPDSWCQTVLLKKTDKKSRAHFLWRFSIFPVKFTVIVKRRSRLCVHWMHAC